MEQGEFGGDKSVPELETDDRRSVLRQTQTNIVTPGWMLEDIAAEKPITEGCIHHPGIEFPAFLECPQCEEERKNKARADWHIGRRRAGIICGIMETDAMSEKYEWSLAEIVCLVLVISAIATLLITATYRGNQELDRTLNRIEREEQR